MSSTKAKENLNPLTIERIARTLSLHALHLKSNAGDSVVKLNICNGLLRATLLADPSLKESIEDAEQSAITGTLQIDPLPDNEVTQNILSLVTLVTDQMTDESALTTKAIIENLLAYDRSLGEHFKRLYDNGLDRISDHRQDEIRSKREDSKVLPYFPGSKEYDAAKNLDKTKGYYELMQIQDGELRRITFGVSDSEKLPRRNGIWSSIPNQYKTIKEVVAAAKYADFFRNHNGVNDSQKRGKYSIQHLFHFTN